MRFPTHRRSLPAFGVTLRAMSAASGDMALIQQCQDFFDERRA
jgi:hypothetical protein